MLDGIGSNSVQDGPLSIRPDCDMDTTSEVAKRFFGSGTLGGGASMNRTCSCTFHGCSPELDWDLHKAFLVCSGPWVALSNDEIRVISEVKRKSTQTIDMCQPIRNKHVPWPLCHIFVFKLHACTVKTPVLAEGQTQLIMQNTVFGFSDGTYMLN